MSGDKVKLFLKRYFLSRNIFCQSALTSAAHGCSGVCGSSRFGPIPSLVLFLRHRAGEGCDVLRLLQRGHVDHAAAEGERTLNRLATGPRAERHVRDTHSGNALVNILWLKIK